MSKYPDDEPLVLVNDDDPLFIMYTAGTTGRPKGAVLTHKNEVTMWMLVSMFAMSEPGVGDMTQHRCFIPPPVFHLAGFGMAQLAFFAGATVILSTEVFNPTDIMQIIEKEKVTAILLIPAMATFLLQLPDLDNYDTSSLRVWVSGAAILPTATRKQIVQHFPDVRIFDVFGQTEMSPVVCGLRHSESEGRETSVGKPLSFVEVRVVDDNDKDVPLGEVGEAIYRGPNVMLEYYKDPEETAEAMRGGWFHSTDMVRQDEEGYIYIVDRKKDMIISGGENIYPAEIEELLYRQPKVLE
jgi:acyl-CoA synthetase (AMP-forming)/AMP-acid ligase II